MTTLFITGIDTGVGKSVVCGVLAKALIKEKHHVFTQKLVETGCKNSQSADLITHQKIVGEKFNTAKLEQHCPYTFSYPASPHLAAKREEKVIDCDYLIKQINTLKTQCDHLLVEGAGGLCVPLNQETQIIDFITKHKLPIVLVTSAKLGSINHTLLSLAACQHRGIEVRAVVYNHYGQDETSITNDTREILKTHLKNFKPSPIWLELEVENYSLLISHKQKNALLSS